MTAVPSPAAAPPRPAGQPARRARRAAPPRGNLPPPTRREQARLGILLVVPLLLVVGVFLLFPLANAVYFAFVDFDGIDPAPPWVGAGNFTELAQDRAVWAAFKNNVIWIIIGTLAPLLIGLWLALLVWGWIYEPSRGWLNRVLGAVGLEGLATGWLGNPNTALYAVLITAVWATFGFVFVIFLAALRNVDMDLIDAALLDGANAVARVRYIVLPQIMPVFIAVTTITLIGGFAVFDIVFVMTGGGPAGASEVLGTYAYSSAFGLNRISYGTTLALVITVMSIPFAVGLNRLQRRLSLEGGGA